MIAARDHAGDRARRVAAQAVGDQPFARRARAFGSAAADLGRRSARGRSIGGEAASTVVRHPSARQQTTAAWPGNAPVLVGVERRRARRRRSAVFAGPAAASQPRASRAARAAARAPDRGGGRGRGSRSAAGRRRVAARSSAARTASAARAPRRRHRRAPPGAEAPDPRGAAAADRGGARRLRDAARARASRACSARTSPASHGSGRQRLHVRAVARLGNCVEELAPALRGPAAPAPAS